MLPCEACSTGLGSSARGEIEQWLYMPGAVLFEIAEIRSMYGGRWTLRSTTGVDHEYHDLYQTEAEALSVSTQRAHEQYERAMQSMQYKKGNAKRVSWSVLYHQQKIKDLERQIAWHRGALGAKA